MVLTPKHTPVLLREAVELLAPHAGETVLDVTLGLGGHAEEFLKRIGEKGTLIGLDADAENLSAARVRLQSLPGRQVFHHLNFSSLPQLSLEPVDILFADLGLSSPHVDDPQRGFTFREDAPLDMRYDRSQGMTAGEWLATVPEEEVIFCLREYGELPSAARLARALREQQLVRTRDVTSVAESVYRWRTKSLLPQIFQALRIAVNAEISSLDSLLTHGPQLLKPGGRMGVMSYHSLEDRRVKHVFRALCEAPRDPDTGQDIRPADFALLTRKVVVPSDAEQQQNPRSRSAKLRVITRRPTALS